MREREGHRKNKERKNKNTKSAVILSYICMYYTICVQIYNKYSNNIKTKTKEKTHTPKTTTHREKDKKNKKKIIRTTVCGLKENYSRENK